MRFIIGGQGYEITRESIVKATSGVRPNEFDGRHKYYVDLHGQKYPIKQTIHLVTGLSYTEDFTAQYARHILKKLGFIVHSREVENTTESILKPISSSINIEGAKKFAITLEQDEDGFIVASCPALPGCHTQGRTEAEAIANIKEAIRGYIASMLRHGEQIPSITEIREVEVVV
ncbi:MAG: type II toxin-antitoxin system HicB family antitoxin [Dehalococcoidales bacterium]